MIRGSDGLDYENITEKLLSNPAKTHRNAALQELRRQGTPKDEQKLWLDAYDAAYDRSQTQDVTADWDARCEADRALSAHRIAERARKHVAERASQGHYDLPATQDRCCPG
jgi:hypothetical protein